MHTHSVETYIFRERITKGREDNEKEKKHVQGKNSRHA
jgi:hypothetical protein